MRIGLIVNPIAGMGGAVGLKGTDGADTIELAKARGAAPVAGPRARRALEIVARELSDLELCAAAGEMGFAALEGLGLSAHAVSWAGQPSAFVTRKVAVDMMKAPVDLLVFAGGDGTARDILVAVGKDVPVFGIPCGVKMHSGVFALTPEVAGRFIVELSRRGIGSTQCRDVEIMDIDEEQLRAGRLQSRLYGYAQMPHIPRFVQNPKSGAAPDDEGMLEAVGREVAAEFKPGTTYLIGPGTTAKRPLAALGLEGTLLGVDAVRDGKVIARDIGESDALALTENEPAHIVVGVTGGQGFVFGRGNQQIGTSAIRRAWPNNVTILASAGKLATLPQSRLHADTGDPELDRLIAGYVRVRTAPNRSVMMRID